MHTLFIGYQAILNACGAGGSSPETNPIDSFGLPSPQTLPQWGPAPVPQGELMLGVSASAYAYANSCETIELVDALMQIQLWG